MKSTYVKIVLFVLIVGLLSACGSSQTQAPEATATSAPTQQIVPSTQAPTEAPASTDTAVPTDPPAATEAPATQPAAGGATVSFANDILPIVQSRCINCHGGNRTEEGLDLNNHASLLAGSDNGPVVVPGDATNSLFVEMVATQKMPKRGPKLTPPQIQLFTDWVNQGALDN
jgi:mono/diheme cytochrome c family protein